MQELQDMQEMNEMNEMNEVKDNEETKEIVKPIKKVIFKKNTQEKLGVKVNLTKDKEYDVLSVIVPVQPKITPSVDNTVLYLIKDDNGEKNYFRTNFFKNKEV
ncbi:hypothetical protein RBU49_08795 [Clostridium sp. MB40-C1]|uniref:hypothetical protein n=1 Tax=Clostridium sp. MB40-C1 TaxID=3070996 RepID=UPI0027E1F194|nr:hypothetical protein [Clostridium sp. MB40-C1]WMJ82327.1 hypothetical protein RBU49_08795 [Clostridium sp. MB40-C1]